MLASKVPYSLNQKHNIVPKWPWCLLGKYCSISAYLKKVPIENHIIAYAKQYYYQIPYLYYCINQVRVICLMHDPISWTHKKAAKPKRYNKEALECYKTILLHTLLKEWQDTTAKLLMHNK